jgi:hypothetical protein
VPAKVDVTQQNGKHCYQYYKLLSRKLMFGKMLKDQVVMVIEGDEVNDVGNVGEPMAMLWQVAAIFPMQFKFQPVFVKIQEINIIITICLHTDEITLDIIEGRIINLCLLLMHTAVTTMDYLEV